MTPRLVATDLDGTLLRTDGTLSAWTVAVLRRVEAAGVPVIPVTARPLRWRERYPLLRDARYAVFANGAVVYDRQAGAVIDRHPLSPRTLAVLHQRISAAVPDAAFAVETEDGRAMLHQRRYPLRSDFGQPGVHCVALDRLLTQPAVKLLVKAPGVAPDQLLSGVVAAVGGAAQVSTSSGDGLAEVATAGVTKATGLAVAASRLGLPAAEVVAFGDMPNDLPMLSWAGRAVAVANAHPDVLAIADQVTGSNDADGVASWMAERWPTVSRPIRARGADPSVDREPAPGAEPDRARQPEVPAAG